MKRRTIFLFSIFSLLIFACAKQTAEDHFKKGVRYQLMANSDSAILEYQKAIKSDSTYVQAHLNLGVLYTEKGMYDQAIESYKKIIRFTPLHAKAYYNLGYVYSIKGDKEKAQEQYEQLKSLDPQLAQKLKEKIEQI